MPKIQAYYINGAFEVKKIFELCLSIKFIVSLFEERVI